MYDSVKMNKFGFRRLAFSLEAGGPKFPKIFSGRVGSGRVWEFNFGSVWVGVSFTGV